MVRLRPFNSQIHVCVWCIYDSRSFRDDLIVVQTGLVNKKVAEILGQKIDNQARRRTGGRSSDEYGGGGKTYVCDTETWTLLFFQDIARTTSLVL